MTTKPLLCLWLILFSGISSAQHISRTELDSLNNSLHYVSGKNQINTLLKISDAYVDFQLDTANKYNTIASKMCHEIDYEWGKYKAQYIQAKINFENTHAETILPLVLSSGNWFQKNNYSEDALLCWLLYSKAEAMLNGKASVTALDSVILSQAKETKNDLLIGLTWLNIEYHRPNLLNKSKASFPGSADSALVYLTRTNDSTNLFDIITLELMSKVGKPNTLQACKSMKRISNKIQNICLKEKAHNFNAINQTVLRHDDSASLVLDNMLKLAEQRGSARTCIKVHKIRGYSNYRQRKIEDAQNEYQIAYDYCIKLGDNKEAVNILRQICTTNSIMGDFEGTVSTLIKVVNEAERIGNEYIYNSAKRSLGHVYSETDQYEKAEKIYKELLEWSDTALVGPVKSNLRRNVYTNLGENYRTKGEYDMAIHYFLGDSTVEDISPKLFVEAKLGLIHAYLDKGDVENAKATRQLLIDASHFDHLKRQTNYLYMVGRLYIADGQYNSGISHLKNYLTEKKTQIAPHYVSLTNLHLHEAYKKTGQYKLALNSFETYTRINDSLQNVKAVENTIKRQSEYEISLKEKEINNLQQQQELTELRLTQQTNKLSLRQLYITVLIFIFLFFGIMTYLLFRRFQSKKEEEKRAIKNQLEISRIKALQKEELAQTKDTLFANISHEFRTPLTLIEVPIKNLKENANQNEKVIFDSILKNTNHLLKMIDELLGLSKMESGTLKLDKTFFNLPQVLSHIRLNFDPLFSEKNIALEWNMDIDNLHYFGDKNKLEVVIRNLLKNAYSHTPVNGWIKCNIETNKKDFIKISISNSGERIAEQHLPYIFDRYYRANEDSYSGTGIGLALSKQIIEFHEGNIYVDNTKEKQVTFIVELPGPLSITDKEVETKTLNPTTALHIEHKQLNNDGNSPNLLIVEDNVEMRELLNTILVNDYTLHFAKDGKEGEELAIELQPDLIISDVMMPNKNGFELLNSLKSNFNSSHIPIILLTARADNDSKIIGLNQNADDYVKKPFDPSELKARINNLLRQRIHLHKLYSQNPLLYGKQTKCAAIDSEFINKAQNILEEKFSDGDFTVNSFCSELALNRTSVNNKLKALTNHTTAEYIKNFRLEKAIKQLIETNISVAQICIDSGFNTPQVFNKVFKRKYNCTPSEYRSQLKNN